MSQARVLGLYSYGMMLTRHCGLSIITAALALLLNVSPVNLRQRLREMLYESQDKRGAKRRAVDTEACFAPLLSWVLQFWSDKRLVLALDVTYLSDRFMVFALSVVTQGSAIPVAWAVRCGNEPGQWTPIWIHLLERVRPAVPKELEVYVLTDRGLRSKALFEAIVACQWHPFMRINPDGKYRLVGRTQWWSMMRHVFRGMQPKVWRVDCYKGDPIRCCLVLMWEPDYAEPCLLITDILPHALQINPYPLRMWIECGFKDLKRGGLRWEQTKIQCPHRLQRLLLVMAVATVGLLRTGQFIPTRYPLFHKTLRLSQTTYGWLMTLIATVRQHPLPASFFSLYAMPLLRRRKTYP
jgi:hypothetical protein